MEAIYNPLPNDQRVPLTLAAARAGKHVFCEKPIALNASEAGQLREVAGKVHIMEAFMVRFHPQWLRTRELVQSGALGDLRTVQVWFSYFNRSATNIRNDATKGGGALMDIGCYPIVAGRFLFGTEPMRVMALADMDPDFGVDRHSAPCWTLAMAGVWISRCPCKPRPTKGPMWWVPKNGWRLRSRSMSPKARKPASLWTMARYSGGREAVRGNLCGLRSVQPGGGCLLARYPW